MLSPAKNELLGLSLQELSEVVAELGQPGYRARQIFDAMYRQRLPELGRFTTLPQSLRAEMASRGFAITLPRLDKRFTSIDGTVRYLFGFPDGQSVETVWMPEGDGGEEGDEDGVELAAAETEALETGLRRACAGEEGRGGNRQQKDRLRDLSRVHSVLPLLTGWRLPDSL